MVRLSLIVCLLTACTPGPRAAGLESRSRAFTLGPWALQVLTVREVQITCSNVLQVHAVKLGCVSEGTKTIHTVENFWILMHELKHALEGDWHAQRPSAGRVGPPARAEAIGPEDVGLGPRAPTYALGPWTVHVVPTRDLDRLCGDLRRAHPAGVTATGCTDAAAKTVYTDESFWTLVHEMQHALGGA